MSDIACIANSLSSYTFSRLFLHKKFLPRHAEERTTESFRDTVCLGRVSSGNFMENIWTIEPFGEFDANVLSTPSDTIYITIYLFISVVWHTSRAKNGYSSRTISLTANTALLLRRMNYATEYTHCMHSTVSQNTWIGISAGASLVQSVRENALYCPRCILNLVYHRFSRSICPLAKCGRLTGACLDHYLLADAV